MDKYYQTKEMNRKTVNFFEFLAHSEFLTVGLNNLKITTRISYKEIKI